MQICFSNTQAWKPLKPLQTNYFMRDPTDLSKFLGQIFSYFLHYLRTIRIHGFYRTFSVAAVKLEQRYGKYW